MKERGIIVSTELIPKILDGSKTQARRVIKPQPEYREYGQGWFWKKGKMVYGLPNQGGIDDRLLGIWQACPYGQVGDRLWVRETLEKSNVGIPTRYVADGCPVFRDGETPDSWPFKKSLLPSIHMPRWASRITLEITNLRVERLQEITDADIAKEGIAVTFHKPGDFGIDNPCATGVVDLPNGHQIHSTARECWIQLWNSLNSKYPWEMNPWVWVIEWPRYKGGL